jgi:glycosyltransferase involved in cell wall biosynthesis
MDKVSIIIPTYNRNEFLLEAVYSALNQTHKNTEIIVVDDGSTDNTRQILETLIKEKKIKYIYRENGGPSKARNTGIRIATGEYIAFLDSDDLWKPDFIREAVNFLKNYPDISAVHCDLEFIGCETPDRFKNKDKLVRKGRMFEDYLLLRGSVFLSCLFIKRSALNKVGLFDESLFTAEDNNFISRVTKEYEIGFINKAMLIRRVHKNNLSLIGVENAGTFQNLDNLVNLFPELHPCKSKIMRKAYGVRYIRSGLSHFRNSDYIKAREFFKKALKNNCLNIKTIIYFISSFIPKNLMYYFKKFKNSLIRK